MKDNNGKMVISKLCHRFEKKPIELKFNDRSIEMLISKMKKDSRMKVTYYEHMMLECCLLFLCGFSFYEIGTRVHIYDKAVIKFLKSERLLELLSDEYLLLFQENQYRLNLDSEKNDMIRKAVSTYVEQDGSVVKTAEILHISPATFREYVSHSDLERIIDDSNLFYKFLLLRGIKNKSFKIESDREKYLRVIEELLIFEPNNEDEHKYLNLAKAILIQNLDSINEIVDYTGLSSENVIFSLKNFSKCRTFFSRSIMSMLLLNSMFILNKDKNIVSYDEYVHCVISIYMNSRYTLDDVADIFNSTKQKVQYIINEKSKEFLSDNDYEKLIEHKKIISHINRSCPVDSYVVKDPKIIPILKSDLIYVNKSQYRFITILRDFFNIYDQLYYCDVKQSFVSKIQYLNSCIDEFEEIFVRNSFLEIKRSLEIEDLLVGNRYKEKNQYVIFVMKQFLKYGMDLEDTCEQLNINIPTLIRVLQDSSISDYYGPVMYGYIQGAINDYRMMYKKRFGNDNIDYTNIKVLKEIKKKQV